MKSLRSFRLYLRSFVVDSRGATATEYFGMVAVIALVVLGGMQAFGSSAKEVVDSQKTQIDKLKSK